MEKSCFHINHRYLKMLKSLEVSFGRNNIILDFETAIFSSEMANFYHALVNCCLFRFNQILYRKLCSFRMINKYKRSVEFCTGIKIIAALAIVTLVKILEEFENLFFYFKKKSTR